MSRLGWLLLGIVLLASCEEKAAEPPAPPVAARETLPLDLEALKMVRSLRDFAPLAYKAHHELDMARVCDAASTTAADKKTCLAGYFQSLKDLRGKLPSDAGLAGCALQVASGVKDAPDAAVNEKTRSIEAASGISFTELHDHYVDCAARLFRIVIAERHEKPPVAPTIAQLEGHLGLNNDPSAFGSTPPVDEQPGALWTTTGRKIDQAKLDLEP